MFEANFQTFPSSFLCFSRNHLAKEKNVRYHFVKEGIANSMAIKIQLHYIKAGQKNGFCKKLECCLLYYLSKSFKEHSRTLIGNYLLNDSNIDKELLMHNFFIKIWQVQTIIIITIGFLSAEICPFRSTNKLFKSVDMTKNNYKSIIWLLFHHYYCY